MLFDMILAVVKVWGVYFILFGILILLVLKVKNFWIVLVGGMLLVAYLATTLIYGLDPTNFGAVLQIWFSLVVTSLGSIWNQIVGLFNSLVAEIF